MDREEQLLPIRVRRTIVIRLLFVYRQEVEKRSSHALDSHCGQGNGQGQQCNVDQFTSCTSS